MKKNVAKRTIAFLLTVCFLLVSGVAPVLAGEPEPAETPVVSAGADETPEDGGDAPAAVEEEPQGPAEEPAGAAEILADPEDLPAAPLADGLEGKILSLSFDDTVAGFAGNGGKAVPSGASTLVDDAIRGKALQLNGNNSNFLRVYKDDDTSLLTGYEAFTISYWSKVTQQTAANWSAFIQQNDSQTTETNLNYIGLLDRGNQLRVERYLRSRTQEVVDDRSSLGVWKHVSVVFDANKTTIYVDGEKQAEGTGNYPVDQILGDGSVFYIGKANWGNGEYFRGLLDEYQVYGRALSAEEVEQLYLEPLEGTALLQRAADKLEIPEVNGNEVNHSFTKQLTLGASLLAGTVNVSWASSQPDVVEADGKINNPAGIAEVTLTATLALATDENQKITKEFTFSVIPEGMTTYSMDIDPDNEGVEISQELFGLFYEDINSAADGGLYPEMVKNNSFENYFNVVSIDEPATGRGNQYSWKLHWESDAASRFVVSQQDGLNDRNTNFAQVTGNMTLTNGGFAPMADPNSAAMPMVKGAKYDFTVWTRAAAGYTGAMKVQVKDAAGAALSGEYTIPLVHDGEWQKTEPVVVTATGTGKGKLYITISGAADDAVLDMDMVSLSPQDTYGYGQTSYAYGKGIRKDLAEKLIALKPSFIRFPGGCIIEGNSGRHSYYNWEDSVGPLEERWPIGNHWASDNGSYSNTYGYMQSYGFGYHEILQLCEDMGAEPYPILSAGVFCQFANGDRAPAATGEELDKFASHATNLIDYCWGDVDSDNPTQAKWAQQRVANGREEPFNLNYVGIGNENWQAKYFDNFEYIKDFVEAYVEENYPGRRIVIISSTGPASSDTSYQYAWERITANYPGETLADEHYYQTRDFMLGQTDRYNYYDRLDQNGSDVFVGEYATHMGSRNNNLESAIVDAAYMTGFERNGDIVRNASYAPLFEKIGSTNWTQNMIRFDEFDSVATTNYYVQYMYGNNYGSQIVNTALEKNGSVLNDDQGSVMLAAWNTNVEISHVKVTGLDEDGNEVVLLEDNFDGGNTDPNLQWAAVSGSTGSFAIADGKLTLTGGSGKNAVWLPNVVDDPAWQRYKVEATVTKTAGAEGFLLGVGVRDANNYLWYNMGGWDNTGTRFERIRNGTTQLVGNRFNEAVPAIKTGEEMQVTVNYGLNGKLEAGYTSASVDLSNHFSYDLVPYQTDIYQVVSKDKEYLYVKLVNHDSYDKAIALNFPESLQATQAEVISLSGSAGAVNAIGNEVVTPVTTQHQLTGSSLYYNVPSMSFSIIKVKYAEDDGVVDVERVALGKNTQTIRVNETSWLVPFVRPKNATDPTVSWTSSNPAVASVTGGQIKGLSEGTTIITATAGGKTASCEVTVSGMAASKDALQQLVDETKALQEDAYTPSSWAPFAAALAQAETILAKADATAEEIGAAQSGLQTARDNLVKRAGINLDLLILFTETFDQLDPYSYTPESWSPMGEALARAKELIALGDNAGAEDVADALDALFAAQKGLEFSITDGLRKLVAEAETLLAEADKYISGSVQQLQTAVDEAKVLLATPGEELTEKQVSAASQKLSDAITEMFEKGDITKLRELVEQARLLDEDEYTAASWAAFAPVLAEAEAAVAEDDMLPAEVDAMYNKLKQAMDALEKKGGGEEVPVESIEIQPKGILMVSRNKTLQLAAVLTPADATDKTVTWSSSNSSVATVDSNGKVKGIKAGMVTITATSSNGLTHSVIVRVTP